MRVLVSEIMSLMVVYPRKCAQNEETKILVADNVALTSRQNSVMFTTSAFRLIWVQMRIHPPYRENSSMTLEAFWESADPM